MDLAPSVLGEGSTALAKQDGTPLALVFLFESNSVRSSGSDGTDATECEERKP